MLPAAAVKQLPRQLLMCVGVGMPWLQHKQLQQQPHEVSCVFLAHIHGDDALVHNNVCYSVLFTLCLRMSHLPLCHSGCNGHCLGTHQHTNLGGGHRMRRRVCICHCSSHRCCPVRMLCRHVAWFRANMYTTAHHMHIPPPRSRASASALAQAQCCPNAAAKGSASAEALSSSIGRATASASAQSCSSGDASSQASAQAVSQAVAEVWLDVRTPPPPKIT